MSNMLIRNIGAIVSGDYDQPLLEGDAVLVLGGKISGVGRAADLQPDVPVTVIDANGATLTPGLIDSHVHPTFGDYGFRQKFVDFIESCSQGGVTRMISAGEVHLPGLPPTAQGYKLVAMLAAQTWANFRPNGVKVQGGGLLLAAGLSPGDFEELAAAGVRHLGEVGLGGYHDWPRVAEMVGWAKGCGMTVMMHIGGASIPGSEAIGADNALMVRPHVASHLNGGPTAPPLADIERIVAETDAALEIIQCGNAPIIPRLIAIFRKHNALGRMIIGTDQPSGTGIVTLGILRTIGWVSAMGDIPAAQAIAMASGTTARIYGLPAGRIAPGLEADLCLMDAPIGSAAPDALGCLAIGDTPGIAAVIIDGQLVVRKSRNTPPARRQISVREVR